MKKYRQILMFLLICSMFLTMMSQSVTASAVGCSAKAAVVIDSLTGEVLYEHNAYDRLPMASTTKIMSAVVALENSDLDESFTVDPEAIKVEGSSMGLTEGDVVTMRDLICGMLLPSGNDAANAAAVRIAGSVEGFVGMMNEKAEELGLENTHFVTPSGLDDYTDDHYSTAYDMARLADYALQNDVFAEICSKKYIKLSLGNPSQERWLTNTNKLLDSCEGVTGVKTGFTDKAKRCLVSSCKRGNAELICVTLNDPDDWRDHSGLYDYAFAQMTDIRLSESEKKFSVDVAGGERPFVGAYADSGVVSVPKSCVDKITAVTFVKPMVFAPVAKDDELGSVAYYCNGKKIFESKITAAEDTDQRISEAEESAIDKFLNLLKSK